MGIPTVDVTQDSLQAAQLAAQASQLAVTTAQLGVMTSQLAKLFEIVAGGTQIANILRDSQGVLEGISADIKKSQEIVGPFVALVVEVEKIGQIIKGDVGLNLGALVDATKGISDTLKGSIGVNISDAVSAGSHEVAQEVSKHAEATAGVAKETAAGAQTIAAAIAKANLELISRTLFGAFTPEIIARISQMQICHKQELQADTTLGPIEGVLETITKANICIVQALLQPTIEVASKTADTVFRPFTTSVVEAIEDMFSKLGEANPNAVHEVGGAILSKMIELGMAAHGLAYAADLVPALKVTGLSQVAAFLVDVAGFKVVGDAIVGEQIRAVLREPMRYRSNFLHRPRLPELREAMIAWERLALSDQDFAQLVRFHGYPDTFIPLFEQIAERHPRFTELVWAFDTIDVDDAWLTRALQRTGYRGENLIKLRAALVARATRTFRNELVAEMADYVKEGLKPVSWLQVNLRSLGLSPTTSALITQRAALAHARTHTADMAKVWQTKAEQEIITVEEYRLALVGLGFTLDTVAVKVAMVSAKLQGKIAKQEKAEHQQAIKKAQTERTSAALDAFRRGAIDADRLEASLVGLGIVPDQAAAMVALASAKQIQKPKAPKTLKEDPTAQRILKARVDETLLRLHHDELSPEQALAMLVGLGEDPKLAEALVERELAKLKPPKPIAGLRG